MRKTGRFFRTAMTALMLVLGIFAGGKAKAAQASPVVVVLDPGHGGDNLGAEYEGFTEKDMTMAVAAAMKEELEKYEGIRVYLTRETDQDMSLKERVEYAVSLNADFFYCLHFNMSLNHNLYGAEVWVSAFEEEYSRGYTFAAVEMDMLAGMGLYARGIKTKLNDEGEDYYGILRHARENNLAAALIEHCHLDEENDKAFYGTDEQLVQFGILDATAVAKYYGLKSEELNVDYSGYQNVEIPVPSAPVKPDTTEPDVCIIDILHVEEDTGDVTVSVSAQDYDSGILYYSYSYDGGSAFSDLQRWDSTTDQVIFTMNVPSGILPEIAVKVYNGYDLITESNHAALASLGYGEEEDAVEAATMTAENAAEEKEKNEEIIPDIQEDLGESDENGNITVSFFLQVCLVCASILFVLLLLARIIIAGRSKKKRRRKK